MTDYSKLFLYSMNISDGQVAELSRLTGKEAKDIKIALIENAADVEEGSENWLPAFREPFIKAGYQVILTDLRTWVNDHEDLKAKLEVADIIWVGGGNTYYLRWILKTTGVDDIIRQHVSKGKVYAGWSAGAMIAAQSLEGIEAMETRMAAPELITDGLALTDVMVVPHLDNPDFEETAKITLKTLKYAGTRTIPLLDHQVLIINGAEEKVI
jgi:dipeptidase E